MADQLILAPDIAASQFDVPVGTLRVWATRPATGVKRYPGGYCAYEIQAWLGRRKVRMIRARRTERPA